MVKSRVEVDQSGRMEMSGDTTVAASNSFAVTVRVTARVKQQVRQALLERGVKPKMVMIRVFVGAIWLAIRDYLAEIHLLAVDIEYASYEAVIRSLLLDRIRVPQRKYRDCSSREKVAGSFGCHSSHPTTGKGRSDAFGGELLQVC